MFDKLFDPIQIRGMELRNRVVMSAMGTHESAESEDGKSVTDKLIAYHVARAKGGNGLNTVLKGLKEYTDNITAIVTISDYGEKLSSSRKILNSLPLDEVKGGIISLAKDEKSMKDLMNLKFSTGALESVSFGDIFLLAMNEINKDFAQSIEKTKNIIAEG